MHFGHLGSGLGQHSMPMLAQPSMVPLPRHTSLLDQLLVIHFMLYIEGAFWFYGHGSHFVLPFYSLPLVLMTWLSAAGCCRTH